MSQANIENFEAAAFRARLKKIVAAKAASDAEFADIVYIALSKFGIDETAFRDAFGLSKDAVDRWTQLKNLPQPFVRPKIIEWILGKL